MRRFDRERLLEGYVIHVTPTRKSSVFARLIHWALGGGCHDGLVVRDPADPLLVGDQGLGIGDTVPPRAKVTPLTNYECAVARGEMIVQVLRPKGYDHYSGLCASNWWRTHEKGTLYNFAAYVLLPLKILGDWVHWPWDLRPWDWCTEAVMWAWLRGAGSDLNADHVPPGLREYDYWRRPGDTHTDPLRPTPLTTLKRLREGIFEDFTEECFPDDGNHSS